MFGIINIFNIHNNVEMNSLFEYLRQRRYQLMEKGSN